MGAAVVDDQGRRVGPGVVGELALTRHSAGLTRGLWRNPERYLDTYWRRFANLWVHGDFAFTDDDGMWYVLGRSDDTLKVSGRRTGPAEIEAPLLATGRVSDVAVVGLPDPRQGEVLACVCVPLPAEDVVTLRADLIAAVEQAMGKALRPREVIFVTELPKTRTQKIMRRVVKAILLCTDPGDLSSLANPDSLTALRAARRAGV